MRVLPLGGIAGPVLFAAVVLVLRALRPAYSHSQHLISELGVTGTPYASQTAIG